MPVENDAIKQQIKAIREADELNDIKKLTRIRNKELAQSKQEDRHAQARKSGKNSTFWEDAVRKGEEASITDDRFTHSDWLAAARDMVAMYGALTKAISQSEEEILEYASTSFFEHFNDLILEPITNKLASTSEGEFSNNCVIT